MSEPSTNVLEQTLAGGSAKNFVNGDGSDFSLGLRHGDQTCSVVFERKTADLPQINLVACF